MNWAPVEMEAEEAAPTEEVAPAVAPLVRDGSVGSFLRTYRHLILAVATTATVDKSEIDKYLEEVVRCRHRH